MKRYIWLDINTPLWVHSMQGTHQNLQTARFVSDVLPVTLPAGVNDVCRSTFVARD
jgi:hypothetical protein